METKPGFYTTGYAREKNILEGIPRGYLATFKVSIGKLEADDAGGSRDLFVAPIFRYIIADCGHSVEFEVQSIVGYQNQKADVSTMILSPLYRLPPTRTLLTVLKYVQVTLSAPIQLYVSLCTVWQIRLFVT